MRTALEVVCLLVPIVGCMVAATHPGSVPEIDTSELYKTFTDYIAALHPSSEVWPLGAYWDLDFQHGCDYDSLVQAKNLIMCLVQLQPSLRFKPAQLRSVLERVLVDFPRAADPGLPNSLHSLKLSRRVMVISYHIRRCWTKPLPTAPPRGVREREQHK